MELHAVLHYGRGPVGDEALATLMASAALSVSNCNGLGAGGGGAVTGLQPRFHVG